MTGEAVAAFVGLGSNLADPERQVRQALEELDALPGSRLLRRSRLYRSTPHGPVDQPDYVNAVAMLQTVLEAETLLDALHQIEHRHARVRTMHWGPRTLDLDLLLYGDRQIDSVRLTVPHPQMHRRAFVLVPLYEIAPELELPGIGPLEGLMRGVDDADLRLLVGPGDN